MIPASVRPQRREPLRRALRAFAFLGAAATVWAWLALRLLARITPALLPGEELTLPASLPEPLSLPAEVLGDRLPPVPSALKIQSPGPESVFNRPIVVLLAGIDSRPGDPIANQRTDTIMLARLDPTERAITVLSVPRDLLMTIAPSGRKEFQDRANASFAAGARNGKSLDAGMRQLQSDLERNLAVTIDHWVLLDFHGAQELIDGMGGLEIEIPSDLAIERWWYSDDDVHGRWIALPAGRNRLTGYEAVAFSRLREYDDDFHRIRRQQLVLTAALRQGVLHGLLDDPMGLWQAYGDAVSTNIPSMKLPGYGLLLRRSAGNLKVFSLAEPIDGRPSVTDVQLPSGAAVLKARPSALAYWLDRFNGRETGAPQPQRGVLAPPLGSER